MSARVAPRLVIEGCAVATVDPNRNEYAYGHLVVEGSVITAVGDGPAPQEYRSDGATRIDGSSCLATPGLVNCHHHLYQWATRGLAQQATLFEWLVELYPLWAHIDEEIERAAARAGLAALARSGCTTTTDHHYVFPRGAGDLLAVEVEAAVELGLRFHPCRGSMDLGRSRGGLPPDEVVEDRDELGWLEEDVWLAHCVHLSEEEVRRFGATKTGVAHCPSSNARLGAGIAPVAPLVRAGVPVGLGSDGAASNEAGELGMELREALLLARLAGGPSALTPREALELGTVHGARCLGREAEIGSLEVGKLADVALWRIDDTAHAGISDPVAALVLGPAPHVELLLINGRVVVEGGELGTADEAEVAREIDAASRRLAKKVDEHVS